MGENVVTGIDRRDLLKKGAAAGGIVWAAPLILSDTAGAQTPAGSPPPCQTFYWGKYATNETSGVITGDCVGEASHCYNLTNPGPTAGPGYVAGRTYSSGCGTVVSASGQTIVLHKHLNGDTSSPVIQGVTGYTKGGSGEGSCAAASVSQDPVTGNWSLVFPTSTAAGGFSHIEFSFCV